MIYLIIDMNPEKEFERTFSVEELQEAIKREVFSPDILFYRKEMINYFLRKINIQEDKLENEDFPLSAFVKDILTYDLD